MATQTVPTEAHQPVEEKVDEEIPKVAEKESLSPGEKGAEAQQIEPAAVQVSKESISDAGKSKTEQSEEEPKIVEQLKEVEETLEVKSEEATEKVVPEVEVKLEGQSEKVAEKGEILSMEVDKLDFVAPEVEAKLERQSEQVTEKIDKLDMVAAEVEAKLGGQSEVAKKVEAVSREGKKLVLVVPEVDTKQETPTDVKPKVKDEETLADKVDKLDTVAAEVEEKLGQSEVTEKVETVSEEGKKLVSVVPEVDTKQATPTEAEPKVKDEETSANKVDKLDTVAAEVEAKLGGQSEGTEKVETVSKEGEKPVSVVPEVDTKQETPTEVEPKVKDKETLADKIEENIRKEEETSVCISSEQAVSRNQEPENAKEKGVVESSLPDVTERKESSAASSVESLSKDPVVEESAQPIGEEVVTGEDKDAAVEKNGSEEIAKDEKPAIVETNEDGTTEEKLDDVKEPPKTDLEVKERKVSKDGDDTKTSQDLPKEAPVKPTQKQSNNLISKVKQSLLKAKKAITRKSPTSKTKDDIKSK